MKQPDASSFPPPGSLVTVQKLDALGQPVLDYTGQILARSQSGITLQASFGGDPVNVEGIDLEPGDRFIEHYFVDRWYSIFEIYDRDDGRLKGWYCNINRPAVLTKESVAADDLALDLLVKADGQAIILDQDEFRALRLSPDERKSSLEALKKLQSLALAGKLPHTDAVIGQEVLQAEPPDHEKK